MIKEILIALAAMYVSIAIVQASLIVRLAGIYFSCGKEVYTRHGIINKN